MPLVRIDLKEGASAAFRQSLGQIVHTAMAETLNVPVADKFQVITEHKAEHIIADPTYLDIQRTDACIFIQVTLNAGRSVELKKTFYQQVADQLHAQLGVRKEDVLINLVEVTKENWSFGNGIAQYA